MDEAIPISPHDFYERLGTARAPLVIDVRRQDAFDAEDTLIIGAVRRSPAEAGHDRQGADTSRPDLTPQGEGLLAISYGLSANHEMLRHGMVMYDALYTWCRLQAARA